MGTCVQTLEETERMLNNTSDDLLLCYDTGHWTFSEVDPMAILNEFPNRIGHVHLKNMRKDVRDQAIKESWSFLKSVRNGAFTVPGDPVSILIFLSHKASIRNGPGFYHDSAAPFFRSSISFRRSWPQEASISPPRLRRTVAVTPWDSRRF